MKFKTCLEKGSFFIVGAILEAFGIKDVKSDKNQKIVETFMLISKNSYI
jgi:hypothetical protein